MGARNLVGIGLSSRPVRLLRPAESIPGLLKSSKIPSQVYIRGLQCFKLNGNHTENDRYLQKNNILLFAKCLKMYSFFRICILRLQKVLLWPKIFFSWKISIWVSKKRRILCWFQICWCRLKQMPLKKARAKKLCEFWVFSFFVHFLVVFCF